MAPCVYSGRRTSCDRVIGIRSPGVLLQDSELATDTAVFAGHREPEPHWYSRSASRAYNWGIVAISGSLAIAGTVIAAVNSLPH